MAVAKMRLQLLLLGVLGLYCWTAAGDLGGAGHEDERGHSASATSAAETGGDRHLRPDCNRSSDAAAPRGAVIVERAGPPRMEMSDSSYSGSMGPPTSSVLAIIVQRKSQPRLEVPDWGEPLPRSSRAPGAGKSVKEPQAEKAEVKEPQAEKAEVKEPQAEKAEVKESQAEKAEVKESQAEKAEVKEPDAEKADVAPDSEQQDAKEPDVEEYEAEEPDIEEYEAEEPDIEEYEAEAEEPEAEENEAEAEESEAEENEAEAEESEAEENEAEAEESEAEENEAEAEEPEAEAYEAKEPEAEVTEEEEEKREPRVRVKFEKPFPSDGGWAAATFSGEGDKRPMGPLLLGCTPDRDGKPSCEVLPKHAHRQAPGVAVFRAWAVWGDESTGKAFVSILKGGGGLPGHPSMGVKETFHLDCCETTNNAEGCVACTGFPSAAYDPLQIDMKPEKETEEEGRLRPSESTQPVAAREIFDLLPGLKQQLGGSPDPENLPCASRDQPVGGLPTLGDILRSRTDFGILKAMLETSHIQQLVPCHLTFFAVADGNIRDAQGNIPPACLLAALGQQENQRNIIRVVGRSTMLGRLHQLPDSPSLPVLLGEPARMGSRGRTKTWNNIDIIEKIPFDRGVIYMLSRNDVADSDGKEYLRKIVYWWCLNDYLKTHQILTRFVLLLVDNKRPLPIIGVPPGPRPAWVGKGNPGYFPPPATSSRIREGPDGRKEVEGTETPKEVEGGGEAAEREAVKDVEGEKEEEAYTPERVEEDLPAAQEETDTPPE